jgi:histone H3/H4
VFSDYLDAFIDEAARGAIRLAKHRKGKTVEVKDMALFLGASLILTVAFGHRTDTQM